jgi:hypothetical protein
MRTRILLVVILCAALLSACTPKETGFTGTWTGNVAIVTLKQDGENVTGTIEGYGGYWNVTVAGKVSGSTLTFDGDTPLGKLAIILADDSQSFHSADPATAFCASRKSTLPEGCGFSGTWKLKSDLVPAGSVAKLTQSIASVTGSVYGPDGKVLVPLNATVNWGKGWQAIGANAWGDFTLSMTADEKAFGLAANNQFSNEWCGLREGESSAYVMYFTCTVP